MKNQGNRILVELEAVAFWKLIVDLSNARHHLAAGSARGTNVDFGWPLRCMAMLESGRSVSFKKW
jgi:hypothetical protein